MTQTFNGILNDNGTEMKVILHLKKITTLPYIAECYLDNDHIYAYMGRGICIIQNTTYDYRVKKSDNEILIIGKEHSNFFHSIFSCFYKPKFFVLTNKEEV